MLDNRRVEEFRFRLLEWFASVKRDLPWRRSPSPYQVWVSEVMLQQTRVEVVKGYYERWMRALPTLRHLAEADEAEVLELWQGLGYYSRARRLKRGAESVLASLGGQLPEAPEELLRIPGIGPYSAGAIASIAFGRSVPAVDGNVVRVLARWLGVRGDPTRGSGKKAIEGAAARLVSPSHPGDSNQALMELGATVCTPRAPICSACPLLRTCVAYSAGLTATLPETPARPLPVLVRLVTWVIRAGDRVLVVRREAGARWWEGLWVFPTVELGTTTGGALIGAHWATSIEASDRDSAEVARRLLALSPGSAPEEASGVQVGGPRRLSDLRGQVTRFKLSFEPYLVEVRGRKVALDRWGRARGGVWASQVELEQWALAAPFRKLAGRLQGTPD